MKKVFLVFALMGLLSLVGVAQPQLSWRFAHYEVINAGTQLKFDVQVRASAATTYHRDLQVYLNYNTSGFSSGIVTGGHITVTPGSLMNNHYSVVNTVDNTSSKIAIITEATDEFTHTGSAANFNLMPSSYATLMSITMDITDNTALAGISFDHTLMNGGQYYQSTAVVAPIKYADPCSYVNSLVNMKLSSAYGIITYANGANTPLSSIHVDLMSGGSSVASSVTDASGTYNLSSISDGSYTLTNSTSKTWGGLSMTDVLAVKQHVLGASLLTGINLLAADVTWDSPHNVSMTDALSMNQKVLNSAVVFSAPDFVFENNSITVNNGIGSKSYQSLCSGDVNGSYTPPAK